MRLPKFRRVPEKLSAKRITDRSITIIETIGRYRFISSKDILRLVGGNEDVTHRHLQHLYHRNLISRFTLPSRINSGSFIYFLDNMAGLRQLADAGRINQDAFDWQQIAQNRAKYSKGEQGVGQFLFIQHELMISAFRASLEMACRQRGNIRLERFLHGPQTWNRVQNGAGRTLPHRPDAFFTLFFPNAAEGQQRSNFFYEADRQTMNLKKIKEKFEAYLHFLLSGKYSEQYGARKIRAVLVETITAERAGQMKEVALGLSSKEPLAKMLFWFTNTEKQEANKSLSLLTPIWQVASDERARSLLD